MDDVKVGSQTVSEYRWLTDGTKAGVRGYDNGVLSSGLEYLGSLVYKRDASGELTLESTGFGGGRINKATNDYEVDYFLTDHLGSTRVVAKPGVNGIEIVERNNFYPFGARHKTPNAAITDNRYRFSGKEDQESLGLHFQDFGARMYDAPLGRFWSPDPLQQYHSGYIYCGNNPITKVDPNGKWDVTVHAYNDRAKHGYGVLVLSDRSGNEIFRARVRVEGSKRSVDRRVRTNTLADTPTGTYAINGWSPRSNRQSYGPNDILEIEYIEGEAYPGRSQIRLHGGRQEDFIDGEWVAQDNPTLENTEGCIRMFDADIAEMKRITLALEEMDPEERGNFLWVKNDLTKRGNSYFYQRAGNVNLFQKRHLYPYNEDSENDYEIWRAYIDYTLAQIELMGMLNQ